MLGWAGVSKPFRHAHGAGLDRCWRLQRSLDRETLYPHIIFRDLIVRLVHFASLLFTSLFRHMPNPVVLTPCHVKSMSCFIGI